MGEEFETGVCSSMRWWNTMRSTTNFDAPTSFSCSKAMSHESINWNQPLLPIEFDQISTAIEDSSINPLKEAFIPGFFEPKPMEEVNNELLHPHFFEVPSLPNQQQQMNLSNNTQFWEPSANLTPVQFVDRNFDIDSNCRNLTRKPSVTKESGREPAMKKPRLGTPSLLPTFKVRKEKLGDRITALQQLVSPFGKTDTASVLHEAIDYIKFLHDQVDVLTTPYIKNGHQMGLKRTKNCNEEPSQSLRSQGLCLVPISSTFAVASEFPMDFWTPYNFGGSYK